MKVPAKTRDFSRMDAVNNIQRAFELIGGVDRLTLWANNHPKEFFTQLYPKLLPSTSVNIVGDTTIEIVHALPPTPLDVYNGSITDDASGTVEVEGRESRSLIAADDSPV